MVATRFKHRARESITLMYLYAPKARFVPKESCLKK